MKRFGLIIVVLVLIAGCNPMKNLQKPYTERLNRYEKEQRQMLYHARKCASYDGTVKKTRSRLFTDAFHHYRYNKLKDCPAVEKKKK